MSKLKFIQALHKKSAYERKLKESKDEVITGIRNEAFYKIRLRESMKKVDKLLDGDDVDYVVVSVKSEDLTEFNRVLYSGEMKFYNISKMASEEGLSLYMIAKKEVLF